jgi:hypothetical protein
MRFREARRAVPAFAQSSAPAGSWQPSTDAWTNVLSSARGATVMLAVSTLLIICIFTSAVLVLMYQSSHFIGDDLIALSMAHSMPFREFVLEPIGEHFIPLHRLTAYLTDALAPGNFVAALVVLYAFHAVSMVYVYRTLLLLEPRMHLGPSSRAAEPLRLLQEPASWLLFGLFYVNVFVGSLYMWFTAGLHRLPFIAFSSVAVYYYLRFRGSGATRHALVCATAIVLSLGFFTKGVLVPWYLLALEVCLWSGTSRAQRRRNLILAGALVAATGVYASLWSAAQPAVVQAVNTDLRFQLEYLAVTWKVLASGIVGDVYRAHGQLTPAAVFAALLLPVAAVYTVCKRPRTALTWSILCGLLLVNVLMVSLSKHRTGAYGLVIPLVSDRYYYEVAFILTLFAAVFIEQMGPSRFGRWLRQGQLKAWLVAVVVSGVTGGVAVRSYESLKADAGATFSDFRRARTFVHHVQHDSREILRTHASLRIVEGFVPAYIVMYPVEYCRNSAVLRALGIPVTVSPPGPGVHHVLASGEIVPSVY